MADPADRLAAALAGRYTILRELGRGGMATVYLAEDVRHGRNVALKVLRPELAEAVGPGRFPREIQTTAALHHPHILPLYDSGEASGLLYYAMPYVEGESLRERLGRERQLPLDDALAIARDVADALSYAHSRGVIHRDIKPENILLESGHALVADFGIAKAIDAAGGGTLTETGLVVGTALYMSPEQAAGEKALDGRSDVYSLACVLYEMLAGEPPYTGSTSQAIMAKRLLEPVPSVRTLRETVPDHVADAIHRGLARVPADRFATADGFKAALSSGRLSLTTPVAPRWRRWRRGVAVAAIAGVAGLAGIGTWFDLHAGRAPGIARIAVLAPLEIETDSAQKPILIGMYSSLITQLGEAGVPVVGGVETMLRYQRAHATVPEIAKQLGVNAVVEPSVSWTGDSVGIAVRLVDGRTQTGLWAHQYQDAERNEPALFQTVASAIAGQTLATAAAAPAPAQTAPPVDPEAHRAYLQGVASLDHYTPADLLRAIDYFNAALAADSDYAPAYAGLAWAWSARVEMGLAAPREAIPIIVRAAHRAVALDSLLPEAHFAVALADGWAAWNWKVEEREFRRALALNPSFGDARADLSHVLLNTRRFAEAEAQADSALALDPLNLKYQVFRAVVYMGAGDLDEGRAQAEAVLRTVPNSPIALSVLANVSFEQGRWDQGVRYLERALRASGQPSAADLLQRTTAALGVRAGAEAAADSLARAFESGSGSADLISTLYEVARDTTRTLDWLERRLAQRDPGLPYINTRIDEDFLRNQPRFQAILRAMHLPLDTGTLR